MTEINSNFLESCTERATAKKKITYKIVSDFFIVVSPGISFNVDFQQLKCSFYTNGDR